MDVSRYVTSSFRSSAPRDSGAIQPLDPETEFAGQRRAAVLFAEEVRSGLSQRVIFDTLYDVLRPE